MHMFRRVMGSVGCLALSGVGVAVAVGAVAPESLAESSERRGKAGGIASMLVWLLDSLGAVPAGLIVVALGLGILATMWVPVIRARQG
jgi:hypothetical protein